MAVLTLLVVLLRIKKIVCFFIYGNISNSAEIPLMLSDFVTCQVLF